MLFTVIVTFLTISGIKHSLGRSKGINYNLVVDVEINVRPLEIAVFIMQFLSFLYIGQKRSVYYYSFYISVKSVKYLHAAILNWRLTLAFIMVRYYSLLNIQLI